MQAAIPLLEHAFGWMAIYLSLTGSTPTVWHLRANALKPSAGGSALKATAMVHRKGREQAFQWTNRSLKKREETKEWAL